MRPTGLLRVVTVIGNHRPAQVTVHAVFQSSIDMAANPVFAGYNTPHGPPEMALPIYPTRWGNLVGHGLLLLLTHYAIHKSWLLGKNLRLDRGWKVAKGLALTE